MLRDIAYINENIQSASSEFLDAHSMEIRTSIQYKTDPVSSYDICRKIVLDKISFDNVDFVSSSVFVKFDGIQPEKYNLETILDFFGSGLSSYRYRRISENGLTKYLIKYSDLKSAEASFTQLLGSEFRGTKLLLSRSIDLESLSVFERELIGNPQEQIWSSAKSIFVKKTSTGLISLSQNYNDSRSSPESGSFIFSNGRSILWDLFMNEVLQIRLNRNEPKISRQDFDHFYSMLEELKGIRDDDGKVIKWRKLPVRYH